MNPLDWMLAALLAYSVVRAAMRGFFREAFALAGLIIGFLFACWEYRTVAPRLMGMVNAEPFAELLAFLLILLATMLIATLIGKLLSKTASAIGLGFLDRLGGALFGLARGILFAFALLLAATAFLPTGSWMQTSLLAPYFLEANHAVSFAIPTDLRLRLTDGFQHMRSTQVWSR
jgi:membrane protein required for colicin V production